VPQLGIDQEIVIHHRQGSIINCLLKVTLLATLILFHNNIHRSL